MFRNLSPRTIIIYIAVIVSSIAILTAITTNNELHQNSKNIKELHDAQISNCEAAKRPGGIRYIIAAQIELMLKQSKNFDYSQLFPNYPQDQLKALLAQSRQQQRNEVNQLLDINCAKLYPQITSP